MLENRREKSQEVKDQTKFGMAHFSPWKRGLLQEGVWARGVPGAADGQHDGGVRDDGVVRGAGGPWFREMPMRCDWGGGKGGGFCCAFAFAFKTTFECDRTFREQSEYTPRGAQEIWNNFT